MPFKKPILSDFWYVRALSADAIGATTGFWKLRYFKQRGYIIKGGKLHVNSREN